MFFLIHCTVFSCKCIQDHCCKLLSISLLLSVNVQGVVTRNFTVHKPITGSKHIIDSHQKQLSLVLSVHV